MSSIDKRISNKLYIFTFIMTIAIIIFHCSPSSFGLITDQSYPFADFASNYFYKLYDNFGSIALGFFFAQTGFFLYYNVMKNNYKNKMKSRVKSLVIPFIFWNLLFFILYNLFNLFDNYKFSLNSLIGGFSFLPFDGPLWYIFAILVFMVFMPLFLNVKDKKIAQIILFIISIVVALYVSLYPCDSLKNFKYYFCIERAIRYIPAYLFGALLAMNEKFRSLFDKIFNNSKYKIIFLVLFILSTFTWCLHLPSVITWVIARIRPLLLFGAIVGKENKDVPSCIKFTFLIYASHYLIKDILFKYVFSIFNFPNSVLVPIFIPVLVAVIVYIICLLIYFIVNKFKHKNIVWTILTGGRA